MNLAKINSHAEHQVASLGETVKRSSLVTLAQQMRVEFVHIRAGLGADVALPWIRFAMTALVQEVERLIGKLDAAVRAHEISLLRTRSINDGVVVRAG